MPFLVPEIKKKNKKIYVYPALVGRAKPEANSIDVIDIVFVFVFVFVVVGVVVYVVVYVVGIRCTGV